MKLLLTLAFGLSAAASLFGQAPKALSLQQALQYAGQNRTEIKNAQLDQQISSLTSRATKGLYLPQVSAAGALRYYAIRPTLVLPGEVSGHPGTTLPIQTGTTWQSTAGLTLTQRLYDPYALAQRRADLAGEKQQAIAFTQSRADVAYAVRQAYYQALLFQARLAYLNTDLVRKQQTFTDITRRAAEGRALSTEAAQAQIEARNAELNAETGRQNLIFGKQTLLNAIGSDTTGGATLVLTDALALLTSEATKMPTTNTETTLRPEVATEQIKAEIAGLNKKTESERYKPTLAVTGYLGAQGFNKQIGNALAPNQMYGNSYIDLQLSVPVFNGHDTETRIKKQGLLQAQALNRAQELERNYKYESGNALKNLNQAFKALQVATENVGVATESGKLVALRQKEGRALAREVLDADATLAQVREQELQAYYNFLNARLEYEKASGMLVK